MKLRQFSTETLFNESIETVFRFFAHAGNLERITPPFLKFKIVTPLPLLMGEGTEIEYKLRVHGFPVRWKTLIAEWNPPFRFVDEQMKGPYRIWIHCHEFEVRGEQTLMRDIVTYRAPGLFLEPLINRLFVEKDLRTIFEYRREAIGRHLSVVAQDSESID